MQLSGEQLIVMPPTQVGQAAPIVAALIKGTDKETVVSQLYGGSGGQQASTDEVYSAIGNVGCSCSVLSFPTSLLPQLYHIITSPDSQKHYHEQLISLFPSNASR